MNKSSKQSVDGSFVLVIEDHVKLLRHMSFLLQVAGFNVVTASSKTEALNLLTRMKPDLILADLDLPKSEGCELVRSIRRNRRVSAAPVVVMSEKYDLHDLMGAMDLGANDYLPKPFDAYDLINVVRDNLTRPDQQRRAS